MRPGASAKGAGCRGHGSSRHSGRLPVRQPWAGGGAGCQGRSPALSGTSSASPVAACPLAGDQCRVQRDVARSVGIDGLGIRLGRAAAAGSMRLADDLPPQPRRAAKAKPHQPVRAGRCANMQRTILEPRTAARGKASGHGRGATNNNAKAVILRRTASDASAAPLVAHSTAVPSVPLRVAGDEGGYSC